MKTALLFSLCLAAWPTATQLAAQEVASSASDPWAAIENYPYDKRAEFATAAHRLADKLDGQIKKLNDKRATLPQTSVKDWDFAMKEVNAASAYLKSTIAALDEATAETWDQAKEKVGQAWQRAQDACDKVKSTTTA